MSSVHDIQSKIDYICQSSVKVHYYIASAAKIYSKNISNNLIM